MLDAPERVTLTSTDEGYVVEAYIPGSVYGTTRAEIQTFATVAILGPFTFVRPWLVVFATVFGVAAPVSLRARALTVLSSASVLLLGKLLDAAYGRAAAARMESSVVACAK